MNGKKAVNMDEEALFELLATATFARPTTGARRQVAAGFIESTADAIEHPDRREDRAGAVKFFGQMGQPAELFGSLIR